MPDKIWRPRYTLNPAVVRALLRIEAAKEALGLMVIPPAVGTELRRMARVRSTHYSTRIEGNRLTLEEAEQVVMGRTRTFYGRERDALEVRRYWEALLRVEEWSGGQVPLTETLIQRLHGIVERGGRARPTPYRTGQNVIRDASSGALVYKPPEARAVPALMAGLVAWLRASPRAGLPVPIVAGLAHYQFVTIQPYYDGNGRTGRLLATFILQRGGYGLNGWFSLEEHHARDLGAYYRALATHPRHNYHAGRGRADLTPWLEYFSSCLAGVFEEVRRQALSSSSGGLKAEPQALRKLDRRARVVLGLFARQEMITAAEVGRLLGLSDRMARVLIRRWVGDGWIVTADPSRRSRSYMLARSYRCFAGRQGEST